MFFDFISSLCVADLVFLTTIFVKAVVYKLLMACQKWLQERPSEYSKRLVNAYDV